VNDAPTLTPLTLRDLLPLYADEMRMRAFSPSTVETQSMLMRWFIAFCAEREVHHAHAVTRALVERYQHHLFTLRVKVGAPSRPSSDDVASGDAANAAALRPLSVRGQHGRLWAVVRFFRWAVRAGHVEHSPAAVIELPRLPHPLPKPALSEAEVERIVALPDVNAADGLRNRALLEVLYATGIRRGEATQLTLDCIERERGVLRIEQGKGRKGRIVPISARALTWLDRYLDQVWSRFPQAMAHRRVFISVDDAKRHHQGRPLSASTLTRILGNYVAAAGVNKAGACHIFRHTAATLMMEHGADIRAIQDFLGHSDLKTTGIYTNVSLKFLKEQHAKTHPSSFASGDAQAAPSRSPR
jgi:integrase/recombinase XerD